jgi:hypothetical protein
MLHRRSPVAPLYSEFGYPHIGFRRASLCLRELAYLPILPDSHLAHRALLASQDLTRRHKPSWVGDLATILQNLGVQFASQELENCNSRMLKSLSKRVFAGACREVNAAIARDKHLYLLQNRLEPAEEGPPRRLSITLRHYLTRVASNQHRRCLTWLLCGMGPFATTRLRGKNPPVPEMNRICRFCRCHVESPEHVLVQCDADAKLSAFRGRLWETSGYRRGCSGPISDEDSIAVLKRLLGDWDAVIPLGEFVYEVFEYCEVVPMFLL